jgi:hypothetical protein
MISTKQIMDDAKQRYATVDQMAFSKMEDLLATPLDNIQNFEKHIASQKKHILMQTAAGYPIEEYQQVRIFRKSVIGHHLIADCMRDFDREFPDPLLHRYHDIITYVKTHLPNIRASASLSSTSTGKAYQASSFSPAATPATATMNMTLTELQCAYSVLEYKHKALQGNRQKRSGGGKDRDGKKPRSGGKTTADTTTDECKFYCHVHGYQNSHNSSQCKVMSSEPQNFNTDMRKASNPDHPPGGFRAVRGKLPGTAASATVQATGFMISGHDNPTRQPRPDTTGQAIAKLVSEIESRPTRLGPLPWTHCSRAQLGCWRGMTAPMPRPMPNDAQPYTTWAARVLGLTPQGIPHPQTCHKPHRAHRLRIHNCLGCPSLTKNTSRGVEFPPRHRSLRNRTHFPLSQSGRRDTQPEAITPCTS